MSMRMHVGGVHGLLDGYKRFHEKHFEQDTKLFRELSTKGQSPRVMMIACSDSRVDPSILFDASAGEMFVVRNVANLVPPYQDDDDGYHGTSAALEFAVRHLGVEHVVVLGHSACGGIRRLMDKAHDEKNDEFSFIDPWIKIAEDARPRLPKDAKATKEHCTDCERSAITVSLKNLETFPWIKSRMEKGELTAHGWYFSIDSGTLEVWDETKNRFVAS